jgi:hypothetical protein
VLSSCVVVLLLKGRVKQTDYRDSQCRSSVLTHTRISGTLNIQKMVNGVGGPAVTLEFCRFRDNHLYIIREIK